MPSNVNGQNAGLSDLWNELSDYPRIRLHKTIHFGYPLVHVLDDEGRELARRIHSTGHWELRATSPEQWVPLPGDDLTEYVFQGDEELDCFNLDLLFDYQIRPNE